MANGRGARGIGPARASSPVRSWSTDGTAYAACAWAFVFAAMSFYWAAGGMAGVDTLGASIKDLSLTRPASFIALLWITGSLKVVGGLCALALVRPWGRVIPRWLLLVAAWAGGIALTVYGAIPLIVGALVLTGTTQVKGPVDRTGLRWHVALWDPWWVLGGLLFWSYQRRSRPGPVGVAPGDNRQAQ